MITKPVKVLTSREIDQLIIAFQSATLPRSEWNHEAHLIVGLWYLLNYPESQAINRIRYAIQRYNRLCGIKTTKDNGYHETLTMFWVKMINNFLLVADKKLFLEETAVNLVESLGDVSLPFKYYSRQRLLSWKARIMWLEPDLKMFE
jgi:hypothetical protein